MSQTAWKLKYRLINLASRLPLHERLHYLGQKMLGRQRLDGPEMLRRATEVFRLLHYAGGRVQGRDVLEIGTGWFPFVPLLAHLLGARRVFTVDIHPWLTLRHTRQTVDAIRDLADTAAAKLGVEPAEFSLRADDLAHRAGKAREIADIFGPAQIHYLPRTDLLEADMPPNSLDAVFSSNVLEHIPPDTLSAIHRKTAQLVRAGGFAVHRFNPGDHFANLSGSTIRFLECDDREWQGLGGRGLSYHNRLRTCEHAELIRETGWTPAFWAEQVDREAIEQLREGRIVPVPRYAEMSPEQICAFYAWFVLRKDAAASAAAPLRCEWIDDILDRSPAHAASGAVDS